MTETLRCTVSVYGYRTGTGKLAVHEALNTADCLLPERNG